MKATLKESLVASYKAEDSLNMWSSTIISEYLPNEVKMIPM